MPEPSQIEDRKSQILFPVLIALAAVVVYLNALHGPFVFDDVQQVVRNMGIRSLDGLGRMLRDDPRPVTGMTLALNYALGGLSVVGYHLFNIAAHAACALMLYALVGRTMKLAGVSDAAVRRAGATAAALLWAVHPLLTAAVTYTIQRSEVMMALAFVTTLYAAARQWEATGRGGRIGWTVAAIAALAFGAGCKQVIVTLPVVWLMYDWVFVRPGSWKAWLIRRAGLLVGFTAVTAWLVWSSVNVLVSARDTSVGLHIEGVTPMGYLLAQPGVVLYYLRLAVWPDVLVFDYDWPVGAAWAQLVVMVLLLCVCVYAVIRRRWWGFCGLSFFVILAPTSSVMPLKDLAVEHRMYLPLACVVAVVVFGVGRELVRRRSQDWGRIAAALVGCAALALGVRTLVRNTDYATAAELWGSVVEARPNNARAWNNLGQTLLAAEKKPEAAAIAFEQALKLKPDYAEAINGLGGALTGLGRPAEALAYHGKALELEPGMSLAWNHTGVALAKLGRREEAMDAYRKALEIDPTCEPAYLNLGAQLQRDGRVDEAVELYRKALRLNPNGAGTLSNLGVALASEGKPGEALEYYHRAAAAQPDNPDVWVNMAFAYRDLGEFDEAKRAGERAIALIRKRGDEALAKELEGTFLKVVQTPPPPEAEAETKEPAHE